MSYEIELVALPFQLRRNHLGCIYGSDTECNKSRRYVYVLERSAHGVLSADGRKTESDLHLKRTKKRTQRLAPAVGVRSHPLEILLIREPHPGIVRTAGHHLAARLHHGISCTVIRAPGGNERVVSVCHHTGSIRISAYREFLDRYLGFRGLKRTAVRHKHRRAADSGVKHLHQTFLGSHVRKFHHRGHFLLERISLHLKSERISILHR